MSDDNVLLDPAAAPPGPAKAAKCQRYPVKKALIVAGRTLSPEQKDEAELTAAQAERLKASGHI